jgi:hypothetical protein
MNQNIWGPHLWFSLHSISFNYPLQPSIEDINNYNIFFSNLQEVIPCSVCKENYKRHLNEHPLKDYLDNRKSLVFWVIDMHNMVNIELGKKILSYDIVIKKYEDVYQKKIVLNNEDVRELDLNKKKQIPIIYYINLVYGLYFILIILLIINLINITNKSN